MHQRAFRDFQFQPGRFQAVAGQGRRYPGGQGRGEFARGNVDGQADRRQAGQFPRLRLGAGRFQYPFAHLHHQARRFGQGDELGGRDHAVLRVVPAHQRFGADDAPAAQRVFRLVVQQQLLFR